MHQLRNFVLPSGWNVSFEPLSDSPSPNSETVVEDIGALRANVVRGSKTVKLYVADDVDAEDIEHALRDLVLPKLIASQGNLVLHGGLVTRADGLGFCLIGDSGRGKSTLSASFRNAGCSLLSDDAVSIDPSDPQISAEGLCAQPRLFPDSLAHLFRDPVSSEPVVSYTDKRRVQLQERVPVPTHAPIAAIFVLAAPSHALVDVTVDTLPQATACMALVANSFALDPADKAESRQRFAAAAVVAREVPVLELSYPREFERLPDVQAAILDYLNDVQAEGAQK